MSSEVAPQFAACHAGRSLGRLPSLRVELVGRSVEVLVPERYRGLHVLPRAQYLAEPRKRPMGAERAVSGLKKEGSEPSCLEHALADHRRGDVALLVVRNNGTPFSIRFAEINP